MFEDDFFSKYSSTTTTTSEETSQETYRPQTGYQATQSYDDDQDYSVTQNFTEQKSYNSVSSNTFEDEEQEQRFETPSLNAPVIQRSEPTVNLIKKRAKLIFETRMKTVIAVFSVIVACLLFISIFNFIQVGRIESQFASKQIEIASLEKSITDSKATYTLVSDDEYLKEWAATNEFVEADETNTIVVDISEFYQQPAGPEDIPSNWFNDVCEFLSRLFA